MCRGQNVSGGRAAARWKPVEQWWRHHHNDGSYLVRDRSKGQGQLPGRVPATWRSYTYCLTPTSTVEVSLCFPSTTALRSVCPESQDWTSFHTWDTQRQTNRRTARQTGERAKDYQAVEEFKGLPPTWTFCLLFDITEKNIDRGWIAHREINMWRHYSAGRHVICPILSSQTKTL